MIDVAFITSGIVVVCCHVGCALLYLEICMYVGFVSKANEFSEYHGLASNYFGNLFGIWAARSAIFFAASPAKRWKYDISSASKITFPWFCWEFFCCFTPYKKRCCRTSWHINDLTLRLVNWCDHSAAPHAQRPYGDDVGPTPLPVFVLLGEGAGFAHSWCRRGT